MKGQVCTGNEMTNLYKMWRDKFVWKMKGLICTKCEGTSLCEKWKD